MTRVLVVDDEPQIQRSLDINLRAHGYEVTLASTGEAALDAVADGRADLVLLDLGLPGLDGVEVIQGLRGWSSIPIVVLSARTADAAKVAALDAGADDYVTKPFSMSELLARLRAAMRRAQPAGTEEPSVATEHFTIDFVGHRVTADGVPVHLTPTEWAIVQLLARHPGRLVTQRQVLESVWGAAYVHETNYLRVHLAAIRRKLEPNASRPVHFITEPGIGYRFETS